MVEWSANAETICGFGEDDAVTLPVGDWRPGGDPPALDGRADAVICGTATAVGLPDGDTTLLGSEAQSPQAGRLSPGRQEVVVDAALEPRVAFSGPATVERDADGWWLRFPDRASVAVGFHESLPPRETVTVPPTPSGIAAAVTAAARTHRTTAPARSHPGFRPRTPAVDITEDATLDVTPSTARPTLTVPDGVVPVLVAAPLAYYLGADLETHDGAAALSADGFEYGFEPLPGFADEVAALLRDLCTLDARLRDVPGETGTRPVEVDEADRLRDCGPVERLRTVVEYDPELAGTWPLATYVDDDVANARYLPFILDNLCVVHPAAASRLDPQALLKRSLDDFFRGETPTVDTVDPSLADSRYHAWRGDGTPIEAFTLVGTGGDDPVTDPAVDVVCNDPAMDAEEAVADVYRRRLAGQGDRVRVHDRLTTTALASLFERSTDLVHFIGHCEVDGLVCPDGHLAAADLETCGAGAVFLNACGSYHEGFDLVRRGGTVAGVTLTTVLDDQAVTVGTTFAELLAGGFAFARALSLARGEILAGRDYAVVGDGTHRIRPGRGEAGVFSLERVPEGFRVAYDATAPDGAGRRYRDPLGDGEALCGRQVTETLAPDALRDRFDRVRAPVRFEGELRWTDDLLNTLPEV